MAILKVASILCPGEDQKFRRFAGCADHAEIDCKVGVKALEHALSYRVGRSRVQNCLDDIYVMAQARGRCPKQKCCFVVFCRMIRVDRAAVFPLYRGRRHKRL